MAHEKGTTIKFGSFLLYFKPIIMYLRYQLLSFLLIVCLCSFAVQKPKNYPQKSFHNLALRLDGHDNDVRTGMGVLRNEWTIEAWIKGDDRIWKEYEAIFGGGEYSDLNSCDNMPLVIKNGYLHSNGAGLTASEQLDDNWHHVAASCNGKSTFLYLDGKEVARKDTVVAILPGAIGLHEKKQSFGGYIDEVRIWSKAVPINVINKWKNRSVERTHPQFSAIVGYYTFDDFKDVVSVNWVGKGHLSYHLRNGRSDYYGQLPMAYTVENTNVSFQNFNKKQQLFNAVVVQNEWDLEQGTLDGQLLKLRIVVQGDQKALSLDEIKLDLTQNSSLKDLNGIKLYYTGQYPKSNIKQPIFDGTQHLEKKMIFRNKNAKNKFYLKPGVNYFLVSATVQDKAEIGNQLGALITDFVLSGKKYKPEIEESKVKQFVTPKDKNNFVKVLQWNIWHGGVHLGKDKGRERIIDLIQTSNADIITVQEGYGAQDTIAKTLGFYLQTKSSKDNLALFSRYPIKKIQSSEPFKSNPATIKLPNGRDIIVNGCWFRYAYRPEYTSGYQNFGMEPKTWVAEDAILSLVDVKNLLEKDVDPYVEAVDQPIIIGGDFNSYSHLDWTEKTKELHFGYGAVPFPTSKFMIENGFKDSFREINPDELGNQGGTFAPIYGQMPDARIDFIYYKGAIQAISSKVIRTSPEIDDVWASDHAAVMTIFETTLGKNINK